MEKRSRGTERTRSEAGKPGGGKGRREDVRGSGIYPASGPLPRGKASIATQGDLGHKRRGTEKEPGTALIVRPASKRGERSSRARRKMRETTQRSGDLAPGEWKSFLERFSSMHEGCDASLQVFAPDQTSRIEAHGLPFGGLTIERTQPETTISLFVGDASADHIGHTVERVAHVSAINEDEVEIESADRSRSVIVCSKPSR